MRGMGKETPHTFSGNWSALKSLIPYFIETFQIAILGTVAGCLLSLPIAFLAGSPTAPNTPVRSVTRFLMGIFRTMPDLFWAKLLVPPCWFAD